jgi:hypothetical protein
MHDLVIIEDAKTVVELGVRDGNSTAALLAGLCETGGHLYSVDTEPVVLPDPFHATGRLTLIVGDDLEVAQGVVLPETFDICFIDTNHWFHHTLAELRMYGPRSRIMLLHDTELEWPYMAPPGDPPFPVRKAVEHYLDMVPERTVEWREGSYGMAVIR